MSTARVRLPGAAVVVAVLAFGGVWTAGSAPADDTVLRGMTWMTGFPATWNAAAPKLAFDGLHTYAVLCGYQGSPNICSIARKRGDEPWTHPARSFRSDQPPVTIIDRKGRLSVFFNDPALHQIRFDHPSVDLVNGAEVLNVGVPVAYLHASYDAATDSIFLAGNETTTFTLYASVNTGGTGWTTPAAMPGPGPAGSIYLYARTLYARGRYYILAGEHLRVASNASYTAAVLFESSSPTGPWSARVLHRATGANVGIPYENWVIPVDLQADPAGRVRALLHIVESGSGHAARPDGLYLAREEDGFAMRYVGRDVDDGFALQIDSSGVHLAFALLFGNSTYPGAGHLVVFRSDDGGVSWQPPAAIVAESALNPIPLDRRNGSLSAATSVPFIYSAPLLLPFTRVMSSEVALGLENTATRYDTSAVRADGALVRTRVYSDPVSARAYRYDQVTGADQSFTISYQYAAPGYSQMYQADSSGAYYYRNSDGYEVASPQR